LEFFAEGHGALDCSSRKADRRNKKRRYNLADNLRRFFRIDDDPFVIEGKGWQARFFVDIHS